MYGRFTATIQYAWLAEIDLNRTSNVFVDVNVGIKNHNFNIPLILDKCNIMIVMENYNLCRNLLLQSM